MSGRDLFSPIEPFAEGMFDVGDGHSIYWEVSGNPAGIPVVFVHGGPGAGTQPAFRRFFDPRVWKIVLFDQRGCGNSRPLAKIEHNSTQHLIADMEALRVMLGIDKWLLFGGSWGSTLALAYGEAHPDRALGFVLRGVFLFRSWEVDWFLNGMGHFFPETSNRFHEFLPQSERETLLKSYYARLVSNDPDVHLPAARIWCAYEEGCARLVPRGSFNDMASRANLAMARVECHYMVHDGFFRDNQLLEDLPLIQSLPCTIVQGRYDVICPPKTADEVARNWPGSKLVIIPEAGHSALEPGTRQALVDAVEEMRIQLEA